VYSGGRWVRMAAAKTKWQDNTLARYWDEATQRVSFHKHEFAKG
jgi:cytosine deaminase